MSFAQRSMAPHVLAAISAAQPKATGIAQPASAIRTPAIHVVQATMTNREPARPSVSATGVLQPAVLGGAAAAVAPAASNLMDLDGLKAELDAALVRFRQKINGTVYNVMSASQKEGLWGNNNWASDATIAAAQVWWQAKKVPGAKNTEIRNFSTRGPSAKAYCNEPVANFEASYNDGTRSLVLNFHVRAQPKPPTVGPPAVGQPGAAVAPTEKHPGWKLQGDGTWTPKDPPQKKFQWGKGHFEQKDSRGF